MEQKWSWFVKRRERKKKKKNSGEYIIQAHVYYSMGVRRLKISIQWEGRRNSAKVGN